MSLGTRYRTDVLRLALLLSAIGLMVSSASAQTSSRSGIFGPSPLSAPRGPAYGTFANTRGYVPRHTRLASRQMPEVPVPQGGVAPDALDLEPQAESQPQPEALPMEQELDQDFEYYEGLPPVMDEAGVYGGSCETGCVNDCCNPQPFCGVCWDGCELFTGVQGFTGPVNRGSTGSFGFHEGINLGSPLSLFGDAVAGQLGARVTHSNFNEAAFTSDERHQVFVTGGLFRRVDWGLQGGVVVDYFHEGWYFDADWVQLRGELSWVLPCSHELGFWFAANDQSQTIRSPILEAGTTIMAHETYDSTDLYAFFYRYRDECSGTTWRGFAGFTGASDGLIGADLITPLHPSWGVRAGFTYLIPNESAGQGGYIEEAWNVAVSLVWRPSGGFTRPSYYQPLFDVASNGTFMIDQR